MRTTFSFPDCAESVPNQVRTSWSAKEPRLEELLPPGAYRETRLELTVRYQVRLNRYELRAILHLPSATLTVEEGDREVHAALARLADTLARDIRQHTERLMRELEDEAVDITSSDSFPASDAPSWTPVTAVGLPE